MANTVPPKKPRRRTSVPPPAATAPDAAVSPAPPPKAANAPGSDNAVASGPTYDEIAQAAYQRYLDRGAVDGQDMDDWIEAERTLKHGR